MIGSRLPVAHKPIMCKCLASFHAWVIISPPINEHPTSSPACLCRLIHYHTVLDRHPRPRLAAMAEFEFHITAPPLVHALEWRDGGALLLVKGGANNTTI